VGSPFLFFESRNTSERNNLQFAKGHSNILGGMSPNIRAVRPSYLLLVLGSVLALALAYSAFAQSPAEQLDGNPAYPFRSAAGKPVVLIFVRTDCPISNRYAPLIKKMNGEYGGKVAFWLVYPDPKTDAEKIREHEHEYGFDLPALRDPHHTLVAQGQVRSTPEAAVFDANHRLLYHGRIDNLYQDFGRARAAATTHELEGAIQAALTGRKPPASAPAVGCFIADIE
jgi:AhpC/TSA family